MKEINIDELNRRDLIIIRWNSWLLQSSIASENHHRKKKHIATQILWKVTTRDDSVGK